MNDMQVTCH